MVILGNEKGNGADRPLYRALAIGDYPGAWLLARPLLEPGREDCLSASTAFNCGLCLFMLEEYERAEAGREAFRQPCRIERCGAKGFPAGSFSVEEYGIAAIGS